MTYLLYAVLGWIALAVLMLYTMFPLDDAVAHLAEQAKRPGITNKIFWLPAAIGYMVVTLQLIFVFLPLFWVALVIAGISDNFDRPKKNNR